MGKRIALGLMVLAGLCLWIGQNPAQATEMVWAPVNPTFSGGNPLNGPYLLNQATAQDNNKDPEATQTRLFNFEEQLNQRILSLLSSRIVERAFGTTGTLSDGTYTVGDFIVTVADTGAGLEVHVQDVPNGSSTTISIPNIP